MTDHQQTGSKWTRLNTLHLDTAGRTWPQQRKCGGCHQSRCLPLHAHGNCENLCTGAKLNWSVHRCCRALCEPILQTPETHVQHHQLPRMSSGECNTFPSTSSPNDHKQVSLSAIKPYTAGCLPRKRMREQTLLENIILKCQQKNHKLWVFS